ncbi:bifunctional ADP-dependent NAD(P)H-hydrate dehydratase/NAD(P)H-hydrate epimerase [Bacillus tuaregi]|uniref:bifunctional ADP-dependent NAD(P)H-hydrate dehydratase/NAD(P)H-hydrate epimerase n=1 Tax=Bacillus tuaregi TaxID=1816695 RepID=UPI0008F8FABF|nr:bifunctional ADP-dependent NAD(P)H-hydrate dehydratase/NAD(P)H-hydrate epimerase [Bacillus tuaregi]
MHLYNGQQIKEIDKKAEHMGMSLFSLMENAGAGLFRQLASFIKRNEKILILAGKGNNGGDGIVLARYLKNHHYQVSLVFPMGESKTKTALEHLAYYQACGYDIDIYSSDLQADWVIDALLGVGSQLPLRADVAAVTDWINHTGAKVVAVDIPTGVSADSGDMDAYAIHADYTYALHGYKPSAFLFPASEHYGDVSVIDIGIQQTSSWKVWTADDVRKTWSKPTGNTHKGTFGTNLLIAGSDEMPGSAALAAIGALRFGTGKLTVATTKHASTIIGSFAPEATFSYETNYHDMAKHYLSVAIGPGLNPDDKLESMIQDLLKQPVSLILDAGALSKRSYQKRKNPTILTPHPGEFSRLTGIATAEIQGNRIRLASQYAVENGLIVVLKGKNTVIAYPDGTGVINRTGNRALSKGGTGDTLTGMLLASVGIQQNTKAAIANAVFIHGACADYWIKENGDQAMSAHDFDQLLPKVCRHYASNIDEL